MHPAEAEGRGACANPPELFGGQALRQLAGEWIEPEPTGSSTWERPTFSRGAELSAQGYECRPGVVSQEAEDARQIAPVGLCPASLPIEERAVVAADRLSRLPLREAAVEADILEVLAHGGGVLG